MRLSPLILQGNGLKLVPLTDVHLQSLAPQVQNPEVWQYNRYARLNDPENLAAWAELRAAEEARGDGLAFAVLDDSGGVVGSTSLYEFSWPHRRLEIGRTFLIPRVWRTHVNTAAKYVLLAYCFEQLGLNRVQLKTDGRNVRSQGAIERLGAVREGTLRAHMVLPDGFLRDSVVFSVTREDWPGVRDHLRALQARWTRQP